MRDWADEPFRKLYTRDNADLAAMPYQAKSLLWHLLRVMDGAGLLDLGRLGLDSLPVILRAEGEDARHIRGAVEYLLEKDPVLRLVERQGRKWLFWPNLPPAQAAAASDKARKQAQRERDRALANAEAMGMGETSAFLHGGEQATLPLGDGAEDAEVSRGVTPGHDQKRIEEKRIEKEALSAPPTPEPDGADLIARLWAEVTKPPIPRLLKLTDKRRKAATARWREEPREPYWRGVVERVQASAFCRGSNDRGWVATFDWLMQPDSATKVLEGKYDDRAAQPGAGSSGPQLRTLTDEDRRKLSG